MSPLARTRLAPSVTLFQQQLPTLLYTCIRRNVTPSPHQGLLQSHERYFTSTKRPIQPTQKDLPETKFGNALYQAKFTPNSGISAPSDKSTPKSSESPKNLHVTLNGEQKNYWTTVFKQYAALIKNVKTLQEEIRRILEKNHGHEEIYSIYKIFGPLGEFDFVIPPPESERRAQDGGVAKNKDLGKDAKNKEAQGRIEPNTDPKPNPPKKDNGPRKPGPKKSESLISKLRAFIQRNSLKSRIEREEKAFYDDLRKKNWSEEEMEHIRKARKVVEYVSFAVLFTVFCVVWFWFRWVIYGTRWDE